MDPGAMSFSLAVKDVEAAERFYRKLGFERVDGGHTSSYFADSEEMKWRVLKSSVHSIGLFQGMFPKNMLTFHHQDVRAVQDHLKAGGIQPKRALPPGEEKGSIEDPDGNPVMSDQM